MRAIACILIVAGLSACAAKGLDPGAERVMLSNAAPSDDCVYLGEVHGGQGNFVTDGITSTKSLVKGSRNDMRNQAHKLGANYVHIQQIAQDTSEGGGGKIGMAGNAFDCPYGR